MSSSKTPEDFRWKQMLFAVSDYCRDRDDPSQLLSPDEVSLLVGGQEPQLKKLDLFKQLVDEGYINAKLMEAWKGGPPFSAVRIAGLTRSGNQLISEMSRDQDDLVERLDGIIVALGRLEPQKRKRGEKVIEEMKLFIRSLSHQEAQAFVEQIVRRLSGYVS